MSYNLSKENHYKYKMLCLLRRTFSKVDCVQAKKAPYLSPVRSKLPYCSPIWRPHFQRRATKYITNDYSSNYKNRLICLQMY